MDLAEFVLARIAEDEAVVRAVPEAEPKSGADVFTSLSEPTGTVEMSTARILAECEAKRAIVEWFDSDDAKDFGSFADGVGAAESAVLRLLAAVDADHPDYQEEWKP